MRQHDPVCSDRYEDYVIRDGRLVGEFDLVYEKFPDPWGCVADLNSLDNDIFCSLVRHVGRTGVSSALDVGCGLGGLTARIDSALGNPELYAIDISQAAVEKARSAYPDISFRVHNVLEDSWSALPRDLNLITMAEVCWYIIPSITQMFGGLARLLRPGGHLIVLQNFLRPEDQQYGKDVLSSPMDLVNLLERAGFHVEREIHLRATFPKKVLIWART